jgi:hypothetical protein
LWSLCVFGYISVVVVVEGAVLGIPRFGIVSAGDECVGGRDSLVEGWRRMGGEGKCWGRD